MPPRVAELFLKYYFRYIKSYLLNPLSIHHDVLQQRTKEHNDNLVACCPLFYNPICDTTR